MKKAKKALALVLSLFLALLPLASIVVSAEDPPVAGYTLDSETKTFTVSTPEGLKAVAALINDPDENANLKTYNITLAADLDFTTISGRNWVPIGWTNDATTQTAYYPFSGVFDGAGHTIKGLTSVSDLTSAGTRRFIALIGVGIGCTIKNVTIKDSTFEGKEFVAAILGVADGGDVVIQNCHVQNCNINAPTNNGNNVGGILGRFRGGQAGTGSVKVQSGLIENCTVLATMSSFRNIGGICGGEAVGKTDKWNLTFRNCVTAGTYTYYTTGTSTDGASGIFAYNGGNDNIDETGDAEAASSVITFENCISVARYVNAATSNQTNISGSISQRLYCSAYTMKNCIGMGGFASIFDAKMTTHVLDIDGCAIYDPTATATDTTASFWVDSESANVKEPSVKVMTIDDAEVETVKAATLPVITTTQLMSERLEALFEDEAFRSRAADIISFSLGHEHTFDQKNTSSAYLKSRATCSSKAVYYYSCTCGLKGTETFEDGEIGDHRFAEGWSMNETEHWHTCSDCLTEKSEVGEHTFGEWVVTKEATERREGERKRTCTVCGYEQTEKIEKLSAGTEALTDGTETPAKKKGCGSTIAGGMGMILAVTVTGCFVTRKKKED